MFLSCSDARRCGNAPQRGDANGVLQRNSALPKFATVFPVPRERPGFERAHLGPHSARCSKASLPGARRLTGVCAPPLAPAAAEAGRGAAAAAPATTMRAHGRPRGRLGAAGNAILRVGGSAGAADGELGPTIAWADARADTEPRGFGPRPPACVTRRHVFVDEDMGPARSSHSRATHIAQSTTSAAQSVASSTASTTSARVADSVVACPDALARNRGELLGEAREMARLQFVERGERAARAKQLEFLATFGEAMAEARRSKRLVVAFRDIPHLPPEVLQCGFLTTVNLVGLRLRSLPDCFEGDFVPTLRKLSLASNMLDDLPPSLANLEGLEELNLVNNRFQVLPECICRMTNLSMLHLHSNRLVTLPSAIARLQRVRSLVLDSNEIAVLPSSMQSMRLQRLNLNKNALSAIPSWISRLRDLEHLSANENAIQDFPEACMECGALASLSLGTNAIVDMPTSIGRFTQLRALVLDWNRIEVLPLQIRHLSGLQTLRLEGNPLKRPTLRFVLEHGPQGLFKWAEHAAQTVEGKLQRDTVLQFVEVLRIISLEGIARSSIFTSELPMTFDDHTADYSTSCSRRGPRHDSCGSRTVCPCLERWTT